MFPSGQIGVYTTLAYAAYFSTPLTLSEIHYWYTGPKSLTQTAVRKAVQNLLSAGFIRRVGEYYTLSSLTPDLKTLNRRRTASEKKALSLRPFIRLLSFVPTVSLVALTGSVAANGAKPSDDIDLLIVARPYTLWLTRPLIILFTKLFFRYRSHSSRRIRDTLCLNLWLDETALSIPPSKRSLYTAHEILQSRPLFDRHRTRTRFLAANSWVAAFLPHAYPTDLIASAVADTKAGMSYDFIFWVFILPDLCLYLLQSLYMSRRRTRETVTLHSAYFHPRDTQKPLSEFIDSALNHFHRL